MTAQDCTDALLLDQHLRHGTEAAIPAEIYCTFLKNRIGRLSAEFEWQIVAREFLLTLKANEAASAVTLRNLCERFPDYQSRLAELSTSNRLSETVIIDPTCSFGS